MISHLLGDCRQLLKTLDDACVDCVVTSPPYFGLRDYGVAGQIGSEDSPEEHVRVMVELFRDVRRVLKKTGTVWMNYGDSYWNGGGVKTDNGHDFVDGGQRKLQKAKGSTLQKKTTASWNLKPKDMIGMPWRVAFALQADGWYLRQDIIWHKLNPMPESVTDRCTKSHEYVFLLTKSPTYFFDGEAIREQAVTFENRPSGVERERTFGYESKTKMEGYNPKKKYIPSGWDTSKGGHRKKTGRYQNAEKVQARAEPDHAVRDTRNKRSVWSLSSQPFTGAHFAVFPPELIRPCIVAGCPRGGIVLDPFGGSGTTALVAEQEGRDAILMELNPEYSELAKARTSQSSLFSPQ